MITLEFLLHSALVLLVGLVCISFADRLRITHALPLLIGGLLLSLITLNGTQFIVIPPEIVYGFSLIALCVVSFDASSRVRLHAHTPVFSQALKLTRTTLFLNVILITPLVQFLFFKNAFMSLQLWFASLIVAVMMSECSLDTVSKSYQQIKNRAVQLLEQESLVNTPLFLLLVFLVLILVNNMDGSLVVGSVLDIVIAACGTFMVGILFFRFMQKNYSELYSPIALFVGILLTFALTHMVGGSGLLAVLLLGFFFGRIYVRKKFLLEEFSRFFAALIEMVVFLFLGLTLALHVDGMLFVKALLVYGVLLLLRYCAVSFSVSEAYTSEEKLYFTVNTPKGISVAIVTLYLGVIPFFSAIPAFVELLVLLLFFSLVSHTILMWRKESFS